MQIMQWNLKIEKSTYNFFDWISNMQYTDVFVEYKKIDQKYFKKLFYYKFYFKS